MILFKRLTILAILLFTSGCSTLSVTYNYADWILLWRIDHYFDISSEQQRQLEAQLATFHYWHREQELPRYANFLRNMEQAWQDGLTEQEVQSMFASYKDLRNTLGERIAVQGSPFLSTIGKSQVEYLQEVMQEENDSVLDRVGETPEERLIKRTERTLDWLEYFLGDLSDSQKAHVSEWVGLLPDTTPAWMVNRHHRQQQFISLLLSGSNPVFMEGVVRRWLVLPDEDALPSYHQQSQNMEKAVQSLILKIDKMVTPSQRQHGTHTLQALIEEIEELSST